MSNELKVDWSNQPLYSGTLVELTNLKKDLGCDNPESIDLGLIALKAEHTRNTFETSLSSIGLQIDSVLSNINSVNIHIKALTSGFNPNPISQNPAMFPPSPFVQTPVTTNIPMPPNTMYNNVGHCSPALPDDIKEIIIQAGTETEATFKRLSLTLSRYKLKIVGDTQKIREELNDLCYRANSASNSHAGKPVPECVIKEILSLIDNALTSMQKLQ